MGFAGEIKDFANAFFAMSKSMNDRAKTGIAAQARADKTNHYKQAIGLKAAGIGAANSRAAARLAVQEKGLRLRAEKDARDADFKERDLGIKDRRTKAYESWQERRYGGGPRGKPEAGPLFPPEIDNDPAYGPPTGGGPSVFPPVPGPQSGAIPLNTYAMASAEDVEETEDEPDEETPDEDEEVASYGKGGAVAHYAEGGPVDPTDTPVRDQVENAVFGAPPAERAPAPAQGAIPATPDEAPAPAEAPAAKSDKSSDGFDMRETLKRWSATGDKGFNPVALGLKSMQEGVTSEVIPVPGKDPLSPKNAPAAKEVEDLNAVIDPKGELSNHARFIKKLDATANYYMNRGDMKKAAMVSNMLLLHGRQMSMKLGALASAALQNGNKEHFLQYIKGAYDYSPDGNTFDASVDSNGNFVAKIVDPDGEVVKDLGTINPQQALKFAMGNVASGKQYMRSLMGMATGGKSELAIQKNELDPKPVKGAGGKGPSAPKLEDRDKAFEAIEKASTGATIDPKLADPIKQIASQIHLGMGVSPKDALGITSELGDYEANPELKFKKTEGGWEVGLTDGRTIRLDRDAYQNLVALRGKTKVMADAKAKGAADKSAADAKRATLTQQREAAGQAGVAEAAGRERAVEGALPSRERPMSSYGALGDVRQRALAHQPSAPTPPMSEMEKINAARRSSGLPPLGAIPMN